MSITTLKTKDLIGKTFTIFKSDVKKLSKMKRPFTLVWDRWGNKTPTDSKERFSFAYIDTVLKNGDVYVIRQRPPSGKIYDTFLRLE